MTYVVTLGHEIVLGHHLSNDTECHHHNLCNDDENQDGSHDLACIFDFSPHFISTTPDLRFDFGDDELVYPDFLFNSTLIAFEFKNNCLHLLEYQTDYELPPPPVVRSQRLRGPPAV